MMFEDLKAELEKVASLKTMQEAVDNKAKPNVNKVSGFYPADGGKIFSGVGATVSPLFIE